MAQQATVDAGRSERRTGSDTRYPGGGIDVFDSLLVALPIEQGRTTAVEELLADWVGDHPDADARTLLPVTGVSLVTLFLDRRAGKRDRLVWYVEVPDDDAAEWARPDATIRDRSPLFSAGLDDLLAADATVHRDGLAGHQLLTHATHPRRQERYERQCDGPLVAPVAGDDLPIELCLVRLPLKPGPASWLIGWVTRAGNWLKGRSARLRAWLSEQTQTLEAEAMYTESLLFEPVDDRLVMHYYMEAESMDRLYDAYDSSDTLEVRVSDWVMRRVFAEPERVVEHPMESDAVVLVHAVDPERP